MARHYLSVCAMFRDEAPYIREWIAFHLSQGVEHFFLYDHGSSDRPEEQLRPVIEQGLVTLQPWTVTEKIAAQTAAYDHCLAHFGATSRWIAFIDLDEFLFTPEAKSLPDLLREYEDHAAVFVFWRCYGSGGHRERPLGLVTDSFTKRARNAWIRNRQGKSIVDPRSGIRAIGPHHFTYRNGVAPVTETREPVRARRSSRILRFLARRAIGWWPYFPGDAYSYHNAGRVTATAQRIRINHYLVKSFAEYRSKMEKNNATKSNKTKYNLAYFHYHDRNEVEDPILRGRIHLDSGPDLSKGNVAPD